ncbi:hypothetical protein HL13_gp58 [Dinoroseobacter phage DFL12phi1]|uniref:Uncharacterized protein n=1 Tax=Dinoroseobacter phage DFL12phi1 TaxID=1477404 RepID=A0A023NG06_9CAUD|nr:hypothetical protein HL13_gp58 [Dinoroseobacter phage DFL12phi1]AHX01018.1 hypothetical protein DFL12P1_0058 [Dinoroseobacter phage DFL12phi1]
MTKAKTSNVTSMVATEESPEFKRRRMKEVRAIVARAVKQNKRVDQLGFEGTDIPRAMIALQDLLSKSQERHKKATDHIAQANQMGDFFAFILNHASVSLMEQQGRIGELSTALYNERMSHAQTSTLLNQMYSEKLDVEQDLEAVKRSLQVLNG